MMPAGSRMQEQAAILMYHYAEWVLITDDDGPERTWKNFDNAIEELRKDGWQVVQGSAPVRSLEKEPKTKL